MSCPDSVTGCESDEISQKMCLGDAVGASDLQMLDAPFFQKSIPGFCADAQYLVHLVDVQYIRVIPEHHTVRCIHSAGLMKRQAFFLLSSSCKQMIKHYWVFISKKSLFEFRIH